MHKRWILLLFAVLLLAFPKGVKAQEEQSAEEAKDAEQVLQEGTEQIISELDLQALEEFYQPEAFDGQTLKQAIASLTQNGLSDLSAEQALNAIFQALLTEVAVCGGDVGDAALDVAPAQYELLVWQRSIQSGVLCRIYHGCGNCGGHLIRLCARLQRCGAAALPPVRCAGQGTYR